MKLERLQIAPVRLPGAAPVWRAAVDERQWVAGCEGARLAGGRLVALWGTDDRDKTGGFGVHAALATQDGLVCLSLAIDATRAVYPDIAGIFPTANRMQRAIHDMLGLRAEGADDERPWLRHAAWPADRYPLRRDFPLTAVHPNGTDDYAFVPVTGDGVHEIPVGPVHAGTIEPGHFRFSIVGERVLRLEERLGYKHKGIEKRFETLPLHEGYRLAGRISGDSTVAYAWAYAMAAEAIAEITPPDRALWLRALFLERERVANHLGDLGFLGNDAALAFGLAQFSRLKEEWLRTNAALFGHRFLMDLILPGGVARDMDASGIERMRADIRDLQQQILVIKGIYDEHAGLQDRFITTGRVTPELAADLGLTGIAGRASGQAWDLRVQFPCAPYDRLEVHMATHRNGDVAARVTVRFEEALESLRLIDLILDGLPAGPVRETFPAAPDAGFGIGWVEGWRGEIMIALESGPRNTIRRAHPHDPSWQNWPLLEHAVIGNIVPDFPLINKSFNLSYSGQDL